MKSTRSIKMLSAVLLLAFSSAAYAQKTEIDVEKSILKWEGKKVTGSHNGNINLKSGWLEMDGSDIAGGEFVIDMQSIVNSDIESEEYNSKLVNHLKSDDFFGVESYPEATLKITEASKFSNDISDVKADLTIKGKTNPVVFEVKRSGDKFTATVKVDRSKYNVRYGSNSFFDDLGDKAIYDVFTLDVEINTKK